MISSEIIKQIKTIQLRTARLVTEAMAGDYQSAFRGRGMEFEEVREYLPGDDIRTIDWNVSARMNAPFVKKYREEREMTVMIMVDLSASGQFGTVDKFKNELAAEIAAVFAYTAIKNNDKVGLIVFSEEIELFIPPEKGRAHIYRVIKEILTIKPKAGRTNTAMALEYLVTMVKRKAVCFLISDFLDSEQIKKPLKLANQKHDLICVSITDPREMSLPNVGFIELEDAETGEIMLVDTSDSFIRSQFSKDANDSLKQLERQLKQSDIDHIAIRTDENFVDPIRKFFIKRERRIRR